MRALDRKIFALAIPALGALVAEPLFIALDSAMVGHLGAANLAGLSVASAILQTAIGLMVFLAYATTPLVARSFGAGNLRGAVQAGVDGLYLAAGIGVFLSVTLWLIHAPLVALFDLEPPAAAAARTYLVISLAGVPAMLLTLAATGLLRGLQDTKTPLWIAGVGFAANAALNAVLIYGLGLGIAGSALGTVIAQWGMAAVYLAVIGRAVRAHGASWRLDRQGLKSVSGIGGWLFVRTFGLRIALLATVGAATAHGTEATAAYHVVFTVFSLLAFALDALAIASQTLIGAALGAHDPEQVRFVLRRSLVWGTVAAVVFALPIALGAPWIGYGFSNDPVVIAAITPALWVLAASLAVPAWVFVLDGVLMGSGDARYLAWTSLVNVAMYLPVLWWVWSQAASVSVSHYTTLLTAAYSLGYMAARLLTLGVRARGEKWLVLG